MEERSDFLVEDLPKNVVAVFMTKGVKFVSGIEVEQSVVDVLKVCWKIVWNAIVCKQIVEVRNRRIGNTGVESFDVVKFGEIVTSGLRNNADNFLNGVVQVRAVNKLVKRVSMIVSGGQVDGGNAKFRSNKRNV